MPVLVRRYQTQQGISLVEMMIGMALGLVLMGGIITVFISNKSVYQTHKAMSEVQETGRLGLELLQRDIRMAGFMGCASRFTGTRITNQLRQPNDFRFNFAQAIQGYTTLTLPNAEQSLGQNPAPDTDILTIRSAIGNSVALSAVNDANRIYISNHGSDAGYCANNRDRISGFCPGDIVAVSDCSKTTVFQVTGIENGAQASLLHNAGNQLLPGNQVTSWGSNSTDTMNSFAAGAEVMQASSSTYYVANGTFGSLSLWKNINGNSVEMLEGVENIALTYGEDTSGVLGDAPDQYVTADEVANWDRVVAVSIELLVASRENNVIEQPQSIVFNGATITPDDRRIRKVFANTIGIRSRLQ